MAYYLAFGPILAAWGFAAAFLFSAVTLLAALVASLFLPKVPGHQPRKARVSYRALCGDPELVLLVVFARMTRRELATAGGRAEPDP